MKGSPSNAKAVAVEVTMPEMEELEEVSTWWQQVIEARGFVQSDRMAM